MLQGLEVPPAEIMAAKTTFLRAIARDLAYIFFSVTRNLLGAKKNALRHEKILFGKGSVDMRDPKGATLEWIGRRRTEDRHTSEMAEERLLQVKTLTT